LSVWHEARSAEWEMAASREICIKITLPIRGRLAYTAIPVRWMRAGCGHGLPDNTDFASRKNEASSPPVRRKFLSWDETRDQRRLSSPVHSIDPQQSVQVVVMGCGILREDAARRTPAISCAESGVHRPIFLSFTSIVTHLTFDFLMYKTAYTSPRDEIAYSKSQFTTMSREQVITAWYTRSCAQKRL